MVNVVLALIIALSAFATVLLREATTDRIQFVWKLLLIGISMTYLYSVAVFMAQAAHLPGAPRVDLSLPIAYTLRNLFIASGLLVYAWKSAKLYLRTRQHRCPVGAKPQDWAYKSSANVHAIR